MSPTNEPERIVANFVQPADPQRNYVHWRNFLRQWWILGPFSFAAPLLFAYCRSSVTPRIHRRLAHQIATSHCRHRPVTPVTVLRHDCG